MRVDVRELGAAGDGARDDTAALQAAIDAAAGRGSVHVGPGIYRVGTLRLRSALRLEIARGATLLASPEPADFAPIAVDPRAPVADVETADFAHGILAGDGLDGVTIAGGGTIDGNRAARGGPKPIALRDCRRVHIADVRVRRAASYAVSLLGCAGVVIERVAVAGGFADGIDLDCCTDAVVAGCDVDSVDDGICLKASAVLGPHRHTARVVVRDCTVRSASVALKLGSESATAMREVTLRDCRLVHRPAPGIPPEVAEDGGVALEVVDGGVLEDVLVSDIVIDGVGAPLFVRLGDRWRAFAAARPGILRRVTFRRVVATGGRTTSSITGLPGAPVEDVALDDVRLVAASMPLEPPPPDGGVPEAPLAYPRPEMFGTLPASGLYCRHVRGLALRGVHLDGVPGDARPALVLADVAPAPSLPTDGRGGLPGTPRQPPG